MVNNFRVNWEKIGVYTALLVAFWAIISQLFSIKDNITKLTERVKSLEIQYGHEKRLQAIEELLQEQED